MTPHQWILPISTSSASAKSNVWSSTCGTHLSEQMAETNPSIDARHRVHVFADFCNYALHMKSEEVRDRRSHLNKPQYPEQPPQFLVESCCSAEIN